MNETELKEGLSTELLGQEITFFNETDSTNFQARLSCEKGTAKEGHAFVAAQQTQGKGTDGNAWESGEQNLSLSVVFDFDDKINTLFPLYPAVALAKVLRKHYQIEAHVKWPNDVLVGHKKISGILCEGVAGQYMIVGIGVNVNDDAFPSNIENIATSIKIETGNNIEIKALLHQLLIEYESLLYNETDIRSEWLKHTKMIGKTITALQDGLPIKAKIIGMNLEGFLQIENNKGEIENWMARSGLDINASY